MHKRLLFFLLFLLFLLAGQGLSATHIVGGEMRYECLGFDPLLQMGQYRITLKVYRDCYNGVPWFDQPANLAIFSGNGQVSASFSVAPSTNDTLPIELNDPCLLDPNGLCVHVAQYDTTLTLQYSPSGYYFVYQRCCRNEIINNILNPGEAGATYYVFMSGAAQFYCNSSPDWSTYPPVTICLGQPISQAQNAIDAENDSIVYSFCPPLLGGNTIMPIPMPILPPPYDAVVFDTSYTALTPMGGNPTISIDPVTGLITGTPDRLGNFVIGVCGREYRNGFLHSEFTRDFQYIVSSCSQSRILTALENTPCDNAVNQIDFSVDNGVAPYQFVWSTGETTEDLPAVTPGLAYTVTVTDAEGCTSAVTIRGNDCVWPGDANYDGVANNDDILAIGLYNGDNGPVRPNATNDWSAQQAPYWNAYQLSGANSKHVDCDGSGSVDIFDVNAVSANYDKTHPTAFKSEQTDSAPLLTLNFDTPAPGAGAEVNASISLGSADLPVLGAYGISFTIRCDNPEVLNTNYLPFADFSASVFGDKDHNVNIFKDFQQEGQFDFAVCNTTRKGFATLYGPVATFKFQMANNTNGITAHFTFENIHLVDAQGNQMPVTAGSSQITTGLFDAPNWAKNIRVTPNPATNAAVLHFDQALGETVQLEMFDLTGRAIRSQNFDHSDGLREITVETSGLAEGVYLLRVLDGKTVYSGKLTTQ